MNNKQTQWNKLWRKSAEKLHSNRGESLSETLIAMLIVALGSILLVSMVIAARNIIQRSDEAYDAYISTNNALAGREAASTATSAEFEQYGSSSQTVLGSGVKPTEPITLYQADGSDSFLYDAGTAASSESSE